jgi:hypothetical protein
VTLVNAQGRPAIVGIVQGLDTCPPKHVAALKRNASSFFTTEFGEDTKVREPLHLSPDMSSCTYKYIDTYVHDVLHMAYIKHAYVHTCVHTYIHTYTRAHLRIYVSAPLTT